ncbi:hypothetical protein BC830DRAFT_1112473 [Chytriomyces sp. MP71]|nr:hypothetical protein BC830DRAFT_1112473 [Chytriomyces sp. MP71]
MDSSQLKPDLADASPAKVLHHPSSSQASVPGANTGAPSSSRSSYFDPADLLASNSTPSQQRRGFYNHTADRAEGATFWLVLMHPPSRVIPFSSAYLGRLKITLNGMMACRLKPPCISILQIESQFIA